MKRFILALAIPLFLACSGEASKAEDTAKAFLDAFLGNDFKAAAGLCTPELGENLETAFKDFENLDEKMRRIIKEQCGRMETDIRAIERVGKSDTFVVNYRIIPAHADSTAAAVEGAFCHLEIAGGKVCRLNR